MRGKIFLATLAVALMVFALPQGASAAKPRNVCAPGFDLGALTLEDALLLANVQAGLADGIFDVASLTAGFDSLDRNNDELVCFKSFPTNASPASLLQYFYNTADNNASVPSSAAISTPELLTPINNEAIQQNNPNIGCAFHPTRGFGFQVVFDWTDSVAGAGIAGYQIFAEFVGSTVPILDVFVTDSEFTLTSCNAFVPDENLDSWQWRVKAVDVLGNESAWTEFGLFHFEPCRIDGVNCFAS
jgi:hypothetical protein